jgi:hypothetical protein
MSKEEQKAATEAKGEVFCEEDWIEEHFKKKH